MSVSRERLARNQALYREVNERIVDLLDDPSGTVDFLCECSNESCGETIALTMTEYDRVRTEPTTFVIVPGHETPEIEVVRATSSSHMIVDKVDGRRAVASMARNASTD
jgi:hypothetical protein